MQYIDGGEGGGRGKKEIEEMAWKINKNVDTKYPFLLSEQKIQNVIFSEKI